MEMFYLIAHIGYGSVILPDKYTKEACEKFVNSNTVIRNIEYYCIAAPKEDYCKWHYESFSATPGGSFTIAKKICD